MIFNKVITSTGKVDRLLRFIQESNIFFAFGQSTPWTNEWGAGISDINPPEPKEEDKTIPNPFIYKKAIKAMPVVPSGCGEMPFNNCSEVEANGKKWTAVDIETNPVELFYILKPRHIYLKAELQAVEFIEPSFRSVGLFKGLTLNESAPQDEIAYRAYDVKDPGVLYWASYNTPIYKQPNKVSEFEIIISL